MIHDINVLRTQEIYTKDLQIGDKLQIKLNGIGNFTATAHKITGRGVLFIFDEYIAEHPMNAASTNKGDFRASDLNNWLNMEVVRAFPDYLKNRISELSIPTIGELFGWDGTVVDTMIFKKDSDTRLELMRNNQCRIIFYGNRIVNGWLRNATRPEYSLSHFSIINTNGDISSAYASYPRGVLPEFWLIK
jgi:hypothetical protein